MATEVNMLLMNPLPSEILSRAELGYSSVFFHLRACWGFTFDVENEQILVLRKPFLSRIASLRGEKMAK